MRIFKLIQPREARGPVPKHTAHLIAALRSLGCTVVTHPWGRRSESASLREILIERLRDVLSVRRELTCQSFDIAVVKTAHDWRTLLRDIAVVLVIRQRCRPVILQLHGSRASKLINPGRHAFKLATAVLLTLVDGIMVLSSEERRQWQAFRRHPPVFTVKNPYLRTFSSGPPQPTHMSGMRALFVGRLIEEKGIFDLIEAFKHVLGQTECELVIVGQGEQEEKLLYLIDRIGLRDHVTMTGYVVGAELGDKYRQSTILVLPSWSEGFPTVLAEAMDAGLPIVTTRIRGAVDHLVDGKNALFVEPRDRKGLALAMVTLLRDDDLRNRMASANRERVGIFEPKLVAEEYLEALQSVARGAHSKRKRLAGRLGMNRSEAQRE
jgi:glycosyltransferase involved in cell wall biosynthesis